MQKQDVCHVHSRWPVAELCASHVIRGQQLHVKALPLMYRNMSIFLVKIG